MATPADKRYRNERLSQEKMIETFEMATSTIEHLQAVILFLLDEYGAGSDKIGIHKEQLIEINKRYQLIVSVMDNNPHVIVLERELRNSDND